MEPTGNGRSAHTLIWLASRRFSATSEFQTITTDEGIRGQDDNTGVASNRMHGRRLAQLLVLLIIP